MVAMAIATGIVPAEVQVVKGRIQESAIRCSLKFFFYRRLRIFVGVGLGLPFLVAEQRVVEFASSGCLCEIAHLTEKS
jgi:hypothetical protein